jgi:hypothetical protein
MPPPQIKIDAAPDRVLIDIRFEPLDQAAPTDPPRRIGRLASVIATVMRWIDRLSDFVRERF